MFRDLLLVTSYSLLVTMLLAGCVVRTYPVTKERIDQEITAGNRGYLKGEVPEGEVRERKKTRTTQTVEIELYPPIRFERMSKPKYTEKAPQEVSEDNQVWGNRGFITQSETPEIQEIGAPQEKVERYTVQKADTLQKISQKFYGTTKKWNKIYQANQDKLKGPDKIYPGQVIDIPIEPLKEPSENLK
ncbi:MAG: hypothetical protein A2984_00045 [Omnitrophica WOR_2 bacterium RIFCSPLOWO2_01_FULL_41_12]|nr:MAG: hypothetical protein A2984_00045 [Omnitrophica WOR_2 bacterium RIFCSPLOWO2_01_FULL_41_12]